MWLAANLSPLESHTRFRTRLLDVYNATSRWIAISNSFSSCSFLKHWYLVFDADEGDDVVVTVGSSVVTVNIERDW